MKRRAVRIGLLLLAWGAAGAIVNVAVAWGCGCLSVPEGRVYLKQPTLFLYQDYSTSLEVKCTLRLTSDPQFDNAQRTFIRTYRLAMIKGFGIRSYQVWRGQFPTTGGTDLATEPESIQWLDEVTWSVANPKVAAESFSAQGWPFLTLWYARLNEQTIEGGHLLSRETKPKHIYFDHALAYRPIWPGFAINTLFYAGILRLTWGGFAAPFALRRRRRIKRGLCPACAYPVGDSSVCTECDKPVKPRRMLA
jgi:hypothetical protein